MRPEVIEIAKHVRECAVDKFGHWSLRGECCVTSAALLLVLRLHGIRGAGRIGWFKHKLTPDPHDIWTSPHGWAEVNGEIIDLTATQFGDYPSIYLPKSRRHYEVGKSRMWGGSGWGRDLDVNAIVLKTFERIFFLATDRQRD